MATTVTPPSVIKVQVGSQQGPTVTSLQGTMSIKGASDFVVGSTPNDGDLVTYNSSNGNFTLSAVSGATAILIAQAAFAQANIANTIAISSYVQANSANVIARSAYNQANTATTIGRAAFDRANSEIIGTAAYIQANTATTIGQAAYVQANTTTINAQAAFNRANSEIIGTAAYVQANTATIIGQAAFVRANSEIIGTAAYVQANTATTIAQAAYVQANTPPSSLANSGFTVTLDTEGRLVFPDAQALTTGRVADGNYFSLAANLNNNYTGFQAYEGPNSSGAEIYSQSRIAFYTDSASTGHTWLFEKSGSTTFGDGSKLTDAYNDNGTSLQSAPDKNYILLASNNLQQYVQVDDAAIYIGTNYGVDGKSWTFDKSGNTYFGDGITSIKDGVLKTNGLVGVLGNDGTGFEQFFAQGDGAYIQTSLNDAGVTYYTWRYSTDGKMYFPGGTTIDDTSDNGNAAITGPTGKSLKLYSGDQGSLIDIQSTAAYISVYRNDTPQNWSFDSEGYLNWPDGSVQNTGFTGYAIDTTARTIGQASYVQANTATTIGQAAYVQANTANTVAIAGYNQANSAYNQANTGTIIAQAAYSRANSEIIGTAAYVQANAATTIGQAAYVQANAATTIGQSAYIQANTANTVAIAGYAQANTATFIGQAGYIQANTATTIGQAAYGQANTTTINAQAAFDRANSEIIGTAAYVQANTATTIGQAAYGQANTGTIIGQAAYGQANTTTINAQAGYNQANTATTIGQAAFARANSEIIGTSAYVQANTANTVAISSYVQANAAYDQANTATLIGQAGHEQANTATTIGQSAYSQANTATTIAQAAYGRANSEIIGTAAYVQANTATTIGQSAYVQANTANTVAIAGYYQANTATTIGQAAYGQANTGTIIGQAAYIQANTANTVAIAGYEQANAATIIAQAAYAEANTKLDILGGTISGSLVIQNNLTVQGNVSYTGNVTSVQITGNTGQFFGYASNGYNALYAGIPTGYFLEPQIVFQVSSNYNGYSGLNMQNINSGNNSSSDLFLTADNGTIYDGFLDLGFASSTYQYPGYSLIKPNDGYLFVTGNTDTGGGNMIIATGLADSDIVFAAGGLEDHHETMRITSSNTVVIKSNVLSTSTTSGSLQVRGGVGVTDSIHASAFISNNINLMVQANTGIAIGQGAYEQANTANTVAIAGYKQANTATTIGQAAYETANLKFNTSGGTITGPTTINANLIVTGANVSLGNVSDVHIYGGNTGQLLTTDNYGNLNWIDLPTPDTVTYTANSLIQTNGVFVSGNLWSTQIFGDYLSSNGAYVLTDGTGTAPAWYIDFDFINVLKFNRVVLNINYTQASGHTVYVQLYNNLTSAWDSIGTYTGLGSYYAFALEVIDEVNYVSSGIVRLRLYHSNSGNSGHQTSIDYVALEQSFQGPQGPRGPTGPTGATGSTGAGVASGGTVGQVLIKNSTTNYDTAWSNNLIDAWNTGNTAFMQANTATYIGQAAYSQANTTTINAQAGYEQANTATTIGQAAYGQANTTTINAQAAFGQANTATTIGQAAFARANSEIIGTAAYVQANTATTIGQAAYVQANTANTVAIAGYVQANTATFIGQAGYIQANTATTIGQAGYEQANTATLIGQAAYTQANTANTVAIAGYVQANTGTIIGQAAYGQANTATLIGQAGYGQANTATLIGQSAYVQANTANTVAIASYVQANTANTVAIAGYVQANTATTIGQAAFARANSEIIGTAAYIQANTANTVAIAGYVQANTATTIGQAAYGQANTGTIIGQAAYVQANTANTVAIAGYVQANTATTIGQAAFLKANNAIANTSGATTTGDFRVTGNLGVGITSSYKFDVSGVSRLGSSVTQGNANTTDLTANTTLLVSGNGGNFLAFGQSPTGQAQWIQSAFSNPTTAVYPITLQPLGGNVGIGTYSPGFKFHVVGPAGGNSAYFTDNTNSSLIINNLLGGVTLGTDFGGAIHLATNGASSTNRRLSIDAGGRVGINVTPVAASNAVFQLTANSSITNATSLVTSYANAAVVITPKSSSGYVLSVSSGTGDIPQLQVTASSGASAGDLYLQPYGGFGWVNTLRLKGSDTNQIYESAAATNLQLATATGSIILAPNTSERVRIDQTGNVLIGSTSQVWTEKLSVNLGSAAAAASYVGIGAYYSAGSYTGSMIRVQAETTGAGWKMYEGRATGGSQLFWVDGSGGAYFANNVGIGTTAPNGRLSVLPAANPTTVATSTTLTLGETTNNSAYQLRMAYSYLSTVYTGVIDAVQNSLGAPLAINPTGGNVGIGTSSPKGKLTVLAPSSTTLGDEATSAINIIGNNGASKFWQIGFGAYDTTFTYAPAAIGYVQTTSSGYNNGALVFATRNVITDTAPTEAMRIDSSGNMLLAMTAIPGSLGNSWLYANTGVTVSNNGATTGYFQSYNSNAATDKKTWRHGTDSSGNYTIQTVNDAYNASTERVRIDTSGNVLVGYTTTTGAITSNFAVSGVAGFGTNTPVIQSKITSAGSISVTSSDGSFAAGGKRGFIDYDSASTTVRIGAISGGVATSTNTAFYFGTAAGSSTEALRIDPIGNIGLGTVSPSAYLQIKAGSTGAGTAPLKLTSGGPLTTAEVGAVEYDGSFFYATPQTTNGRQVISTPSYYVLSADATAVGAAIATFFPGTTSIPLVASGIYEIEFNCWFTKTTAGTLVWTIANSTTVTKMHADMVMSPIAGVTSTNAASELMAQLANQTGASVAFAATGSLTTAVNHFMRMRIYLVNGSSTSLRLQVTNSAGTVTPLAGSFWKATRIASVGTLAA